MKHRHLSAIVIILYGAISSCSSTTIQKNVSVLGEKEKIVYEICLPKSQDNQEQTIFLQSFHLSPYGGVGNIAGNYKPTYLTKSGEIIYYEADMNLIAIVANTQKDINLRFIFNVNESKTYSKVEWSPWQFPDAITTDENYNLTIQLKKIPISNANSKLQPSIRYKAMKFNDFLKGLRKYGQPHLASEVESCPLKP